MILQKDLYYALLRSRRGVNNLDRPLDVQIPVGSWRIDDAKLLYGKFIDELVEVAPENLLPQECPRSWGRGHYIDVYKQWYQAGHPFPPIEVLELENGKLKISNGHRRYTAALELGCKTIPAWINYCMDAPSGAVDSHTKKPIGVGLTLRYLYRFPDKRSRFNQAVEQYRKLVPVERRCDTIVLANNKLLTVN